MEIENLIIGGGISGLSFAYFLPNGEEEYLILEKERRVGGYLRTIKKGDFIWDYSGHFLHFNNENIKELMYSLIDDEILEIQKISKIYYKGKLIDFPFQKNIHQLEKQEFIDCLFDLYFRPTIDNPANFQEMLITKYGKSISEKFLIPYNEKLYQTKLSNLDVDAMGRFFPHANIDEIINNMREAQNYSYNEYFIYPSNGVEELVEGIKSSLNPDRILTNSKVVEVNISDKEVILSNGDKIKYKKLISTIPLNKFLQLSNLTKLLKNKVELSYNKVLVFNFGFNKTSKNDEHWIYFPNDDYVFYRVGFYNNILGGSKLSIYVEVGIDKNIEYSEELIRKRVLTDLHKVGIIDPSFEIENEIILCLDPAYVHITQQSENFVDEFVKQMKDFDVYFAGRYALWTYCSIEDNIIQARNVVQDLYYDQ